MRSLLDSRLLLEVGNQSVLLIFCIQKCVSEALEEDRPQQPNKIYTTETANTTQSIRFATIPRSRKRRTLGRVKESSQQL